jgi:3(or 17)beta-hydroxysteroid dehydrogenase
MGAGRVSGKVAIVTGAASGLGAADAARLAAEGAAVVLTDINESGRTAAAALPNCRFIRHDVREERDWETVVRQTEAEFGRLDILVNNAGIVAFGSIEETPLEQYRNINAVMSEGAFLGCKHAIPAMRRAGGGSIINISSVAALVGVGPIPAYSAAKGAIRALSRSVAAHCQDKGYGIRCNTVFPGAHETPMTALAAHALPASEPGLNQLRSFGQGHPVDVANLVLFLASDESRHITGAEFVIDNGETAR